MEIIKIKINEIKPYENNVKLHPKEQIEQIISSIKQMGFNDPIAIDENNVIIEGHGRYEALKQIGYDYIECIVLKHLSDEQKAAYRLIHNKLTMNTDFDLSLLEDEIEKINTINMSEFDFKFDIDESGFIQDLIENSFSDVGIVEKNKFQISFYFGLEKKELVEKYLKKYGKECLKEIILNEMEVALKCQ